MNSGGGPNNLSGIGDAPAEIDKSHKIMRTTEIRTYMRVSHPIRRVQRRLHPRTRTHKGTRPSLFRFIHIYRLRRLPFQVPRDNRRRGARVNLGGAYHGSIGEDIDYRVRDAEPVVYRTRHAEVGHLGSWWESGFRLGGAAVPDGVGVNRSHFFIPDHHLLDLLPSGCEEQRQNSPLSLSSRTFEEERWLNLGCADTLFRGRGDRRHG